MPSMSADALTVVFLAVILKLPLLVLVLVLWRAFRQRDRDVKPADVLVSRILLCAYCGGRITVGYDAASLHEQASVVAKATGEAAFDVESRLIGEVLRQDHHHVVPPARCQDCGEPAVWLPIEPIEIGTPSPANRLRG